MIPSRSFLSSLLGAPLTGPLRALRRRLFPGRQATRDLHQAEKVVEELRLELGKAIAARHVITKQLAALGVRHEDLRRKIEAALDAELEDVARARVSDELQVELEVDGARRALRRATSAERDLEHALAALLRARREFAESVSVEAGVEARPPGHENSARADTGWSEDSPPDSLLDTGRLTHERRVQERLAVFKSRRHLQDKE